MSRRGRKKTGHYPNSDNLIDFWSCYHFVRSKTCNGHKLESALTDPIVEIVQDKYSEYFESHSGDISEASMKMLVEDNPCLMHHIQQSLSQSSHHMISQQVTHLTATVAGHQVAIAEVVAAHDAVCEAREQWFFLLLPVARAMGSHEVSYVTGKFRQIHPGQICLTYFPIHYLIRSVTKFKGETR
jgi:hypothetical protein